MKMAYLKNHDVLDFLGTSDVIIFKSSLSYQGGVPEILTNLRLPTSDLVGYIPNSAGEFLQARQYWRCSNIHMQTASDGYEKLLVLRGIARVTELRCRIFLRSFGPPELLIQTKNRGCW